MNKTPTFIKLLLAVILVLGMLMVQQPPMATAEIASRNPRQPGSDIDVTYDPGTKATAKAASQRDLRQWVRPYSNMKSGRCAVCSMRNYLKIQGDVIDISTMINRCSRRLMELTEIRYSL